MDRLTRIVVVAALLFCVALLPVWSGPQAEKQAAPAAKTTAPTKRGEAPMLAAKVAKGEIPAVAQRLPKEPAVRPTIEAIGKYGGTARVLATNQGLYSDMQLAVEGANLYRIPLAGIGLEANLAKAYEVSADRKTMTIYLRDGAKWSDGAPFSSEDIRFFLLDMQADPKVRTWGVTRAISQAEVVDDYTIKVTNPGGLGGFLTTASDWDSGWAGIYQPAHYLKKWHLKYNPDAEKVAKDAGAASWYDYFRDQYFWAPPVENFAKLPRMTPWLYTVRGTSAFELERNPYYWAVDEAGNQLPYIDKIFASVVDAETYQLKIMGGDVDLAYENTLLSNVSLYKSNEKTGNYRTLLWPSNTASDFSIEFNMFNQDPVMQKIESDVRFRQALSSAIDRDEMNKVLFFGLGVPRQLAPLPSVSYYKKGWGENYAKYDPVLANKLLDELGLSKKDADGFRLKADGKVCQMIIEYSTAAQTENLELVAEYWNAVGVKTIIKLEDGALLEQRTFNSQQDATLDGFNQGGDERTLYGMTWHWDTPATRPWNVWITGMESAWRKDVGSGAIPKDFMRKDPKDTSQVAGIKPPDWYIEYFEARYAFPNTTIGSPEYVATGTKIFDTYVNNMWNIGTVGMAPKPFIVKNTIGNVPDPNKYIKGQRLADPLVAHFADVLYFK